MEVYGLSACCSSPTNLEVDRLTRFRFVGGEGVGESSVEIAVRAVGEKSGRSVVSDALDGECGGKEYGEACAFAYSDLISASRCWTLQARGEYVKTEVSCGSSGGIFGVFVLADM